MTIGCGSCFKLDVLKQTDGTLTAGEAPAREALDGTSFGDEPSCSSVQLAASTAGADSFLGYPSILN